jgi:hypothetical protein
MLLAKAKIALDDRVAVRAVLLLATGAPLKLGRLRRVGQRHAGVEQCLNIYAIINANLAFGHSLSPCFHSPDRGVPPVGFNS